MAPAAARAGPAGEDGEGRKKQRRAEELAGENARRASELFSGQEGAGELGALGLLIANTQESLKDSIRFRLGEYGGLGGFTASAARQAAAQQQQGRPDDDDDGAAGPAPAAPPPPQRQQGPAAGPDGAAAEADGDAYGELIAEAAAERCAG